MKRVLLSWIGTSDFEAARSQFANEEDPGPILRLLRGKCFDDVLLLNDLYSRNSADELVKGLSNCLNQRQIQVPQFKIYQFSALKNDFPKIYSALESVISGIRNEFGEPNSRAEYNLLLTPGASGYIVGLLLQGQQLRPKLLTTSQPGGIQEIDWQPHIIVDSATARNPSAAWPINDTDLSTYQIPKTFEEIGGDSLAIRFAIWQADRIARTGYSVLIVGETGVGKERFAKGIHLASGRNEFMAINCAAMPESLLESELFGHVKGAFTGAVRDKVGLLRVANEGTVFLDEIGDMSVGLQAKLLRALQERRIRPVGSDKEHDFHARIVAATHQNLDALIRQDKFRADLMYRLGSALIVPPLRARGLDSVKLASSFLNAELRKIGRTNCLSFGKSAKSLISRLPWPGNVRELQNFVEETVTYFLDDNGKEKELEENDLQWLLHRQHAGRRFHDISTLSDEAFVSQFAKYCGELITRYDGEVNTSLFGEKGAKDVFEFIEAVMKGIALDRTGWQVTDKSPEKIVSRSGNGDPIAAGRMLGQSRIEVNKKNTTVTRKLYHYLAKIKPLIQDPRDHRQ